MPLRLLPLLLLAGAVPGTEARTIEGIPVAAEDRVAGGGPVLALRGATDFTWKWIFDVYVAACYVPPGTSTPLHQTWPVRLAFTYQRRFSGDDLRVATSRTIVLGKSPEARAALAAPLATWNAAYGPVVAGDRLCVDRLDGATVALVLNGQELVRIGDPGFAEALMGIWLGPDAFDADLKAGLTTP